LLGVIGRIDLPRYKLIDMLHLLSVGPKAFQVIEFPVFPIEYMYHDIDIIHQGPLLPLLDMIGPFVAFFHYLLGDMVRNRPDLHMRLSLAQDKKIGYRLVDLLQIKRDYSFPLLLLYGIQNGLE